MAANLPVPVYKTLEDIYPNNHLAQAKRWSELLDAFQNVYGTPAIVVARAPGRVNLIGEHIDYSLFGVIPAAIESDILIACAPRESSKGGDLIVAENMDERYEKRGFTPARHNADHEDGGWDLGVDRKTGGWTNFVKAGFFGVLKNHLSAPNSPSPAPFDLLVTGSVPDGAGLSSSAAMVVASTLAFLTMNSCLDKVTQGGLVEMARDNERIVGVNSGGMDQAASVLTTPSSAIYITFFPKLAAEEVSVPKSARFVIANTLATHNLFNSGKIHYNLRVVEQSLSALLLSLELKLPPSPSVPRPTLRHILEGFSFASTPEEIQAGIEKLLPVALDALSFGDRAETGWTWEQIWERVHDLGWEGDRAKFESLYGEEWIEIEASHLHLAKRTKHVFNEALRVLAFRAAALSASSSSESAVLDTLAGIMNASHASCRDLYDCSSDELNALVEICRKNGAIGARLTGAGWGGSTISLLPPDVRIEDFVRKLSEQYEGYRGLSKAELGRAVLETRPGSGAGIYYV